MENLKRFDELYGWIIRWALILLLAGVVYFADGRYLTREEVEQKEQQLHRVRNDDLNMLNGRIDTIAASQTANFAKITDVQARLSRIEAQNEIIIRYIERVQAGAEANHFTKPQN